MADAALPLEIRGLSKSFVDRRALDGVDLSLAPGEILGLLGPNGASERSTPSSARRSPKDFERPRISSGSAASAIGGSS